MKLSLSDILRVLQGREKNRFYGLTFAGVLINLADIISLALLLVLIRFYTEPGSVHSHWIPEILSDPTQPLFALAFLLFFACKNAAAYFVQQAQTELAYHVALRLSHDLLLRFYASPFPERIATDSSVSGRRISQQPIEFGHHVLGGLQQLITQSVLVLFAVTAILLYNAPVFLLLLAILLPPVLIAGWRLKKKTRALRESGRHFSESAAKHLREAMAGYTEVQLYDTREFFMLRYLQPQAEQNRQLAALQNVQAMPSRLIEVFAILGLVLLIFLRLQHTSGLDLMITGAFLGAAYRIIPGVVKILNSLAQMRAYAFTIPELLPQPLSHTALAASEKIRSIQCRNIEIPGMPRQQTVSCELHSGKLSGISGASGSGKTTLLNILLGFRASDKGEILVNEEIKNSANLRELWHQTAYVPQQAVLLHDTILQNITLGRKVTDPARLETIIRVTGIGPWTDTLPEKLGTIVAEKGGNISGGQAQRIIIARALLEDKQICLLDEPFNELDAASADQLMKYFHQLAQQGRIVVLVTHDQHCLNACDEIITLHG